MARKMKSWVHEAAALTGLTPVKVWAYADNYHTPRFPNCFAVWLLCWKRQKEVRRIIVEWNNKYKRQQCDAKQGEKSSVSAICETCRFEFMALMGSKKRFCSIDCYGKSLIGKGKSKMEVKIKKRLRDRLWNVLKKQGGVKPASTMTLVGCDFKTLRAHLESKFSAGMCFENYGEAWHVDHIRPCASFDLRQAEQVRKCFHFTNLQPLPPLENSKKSSSYKGFHHNHNRTLTWEIKTNPSPK